MLGRLIKGMAGVVDFGREYELPEWMGALLDGTTDANGLLIKGAGHKYLRRVPKAGGGFRYFYNVTGGGGLGHAGEMVAGSAFKVKHAGKEGHFHIAQDHGEEVTVRHDESGHEQKMSKAALRAMLHAEHAEALGAVKARASKVLEQAKRTGTAKQQEKAAALVSKYGGGGVALDQTKVAKFLLAASKGRDVVFDRSAKDDVGVFLALIEQGLLNVSPQKEQEIRKIASGQGASFLQAFPTLTSQGKAHLDSIPSTPPPAPQAPSKAPEPPKVPEPPKTPGERSWHNSVDLAPKDRAGDGELVIRGERGTKAWLAQIQHGKNQKYGRERVFRYLNDAEGTTRVPLDALDGVYEYQYAKKVKIGGKVDTDRGFLLVSDGKATHIDEKDVDKLVVQWLQGKQPKPSR